MNSQYLNKVKLPDSPGVYFFMKGKNILYIGKATSLRDRVRSYFSNDLISTRGPLLVDMVFQATKIDFIKTNSVLEALILEANLIKKHQPKYNTKEKDNRSYNYIVITKEEYPRVLTVRGRTLDGVIPAQAGIHPLRSKFGPYPNGAQLKQALTIIRKIFPYRDKCKLDQKRPCFNYQIGLCPGTCFNMISPKDYLSTIKNIELFLNSKTSQLIKKLEKEMKAYAKEKYFEAAKNVRNTIFALQHIQDVALIKGSVSSFPSSDEEGWRVREPGRLKSLNRIEAYDAAHFAGDHNVGVMVVMENSELKKSDYRKFKIKLSKGNDTGALKEMLERRLGHPEWPLPNLIVVDGGLAQMTAAKTVLKSNTETSLIPVVAVTKDERHKAKALIGEPDLIKKYKKEILHINSEAHRFAIKYHRSKRSVI